MSDSVEELLEDNLVPEFVFIYRLRDPETKAIRYVGKANDPERRLQEHIRDTGNTYKGRWLGSLRRRGLTPIMEIIEKVLYAVWAERELYWINHHLQQGDPLTNTYFGSAGAGMIPPEVRAKMSATRKGRKMPPESVAKSAASRKGRKASPETRSKLSESHKGQVPVMKGRNHTLEARAKMSASKFGKKIGPMPEEHKRKISEAQVGKKISAETRARLSASHKGQTPAMKGRKHTPEARAKMSSTKKQINAMKKVTFNTPNLWDDITTDM